MAEVVDTSNAPSAEATAEETTPAMKSHYDTLGVAATASPQQIEEAYNALVIEYSPKVSEGDAGAADAFEKINSAYQILSDATKKAEYDTQLAAESAGRKSLFGKAFDVLLSKLPAVGATASTTGAPGQGFPPAVIEAATEILTSGGFEGGGPPMDPRVADMVWGAMTDSKVERGAATFFRLTVDNQHAENGFVVICRSAAKGRFKLAMFSGNKGEILYQEDATRVRNKTYTQAALYFTSFDTYQFAPAAVAAAEGEEANSSVDKSLPPFFTKLDNFTSCKKNITPGQYLVCVYGDNFIGRTGFSIVAVPAKNDAPAVTEIEETDESLVECKASLQSMKSEYAQAKAAYEALVKKVKEEEEKMENLLLAREKSYQSFLDASAETYLPTEAAASTAAVKETSDAEGTAADANGGAASGLGVYGASIASTGYSVASSAATVGSTAATAAAKRASEGAGWLVGRVSTFLKRDGKPEDVTDAEAAGATETSPAKEAEGATPDAAVEKEPSTAEPVVTVPVEEAPTASAETEATTAATETDA